MRRWRQRILAATGCYGHPHGEPNDSDERRFFDAQLELDQCDSLHRDRGLVRLEGHEWQRVDGCADRDSELHDYVRGRRCQRHGLGGGHGQSTCGADRRTDRKSDERRDKRLRPAQLEFDRRHGMYRFSESHECELERQQGDERQSVDRRAGGDDKFHSELLWAGRQRKPERDRHGVSQSAADRFTHGEPDERSERQRVDADVDLDERDGLQRQRDSGQSELDWKQSAQQQSVDGCPDDDDRLYADLHGRRWERQ